MVRSDHVQTYINIERKIYALSSYDQHQISKAAFILDDKSYMNFKDWTVTAKMEETDLNVTYQTGSYEEQSWNCQVYKFYKFFIFYRV